MEGGALSRCHRRAASSKVGAEENCPHKYPTILLDVLMNINSHVEVPLALL